MEKRTNEYNEIQKLKQPLIDALALAKGSMRVKEYTETLHDKKLEALVYRFISGATSVNINSLLLIFDRLGYDLTPVKRKHHK